jgi:hypothetical protein
MPISVFPSLHHGPPAGALRTSALATSSFPAAAAIVALIVAVVVGMLLVMMFGHLSWSSHGRRTWRVTRVQPAATDDVAELQANDDLYDPNGPGLQEDEL